MEIWKDIIGFDGKYKISNYGNVKNSLKLMTPQLTHQGYLKIRLSNNGVVKGYFIHRLVAIAFIDNNQNKRCVNHKDGNKTNNTVNNLEWVTHSENEKHAYANNLQPSKSGVSNGRSKLKDNDIIEIRSSGKSSSHLARKYKVTVTSICNIRSGKSWRHIQ